MKKIMIKIFNYKFLTILVSTFVLVFAFTQTNILGNFITNNSTVRAIGDLTIDWGVPAGQPIFMIENFLPGQKEIREVQVANGASLTRPVGIKGIKTSETGNLADVLMITISENGNILYGPKNLASFFTESTGPTGIFLTNIASGTSTKYNFEVSFDPNSGNEFKNTSVVFDIVIGISVSIPQECQGIQFPNAPIFGTQGNDRLRGTNGNDLIFGLEGNDRLEGSNGNDCLIGGPDNDRIDGSNGNDVIFGNEGDDRIDGSNGEDLVFCGEGNDLVDGSNGNDKIYGQEGNDHLLGKNGNDLLVGGEGTDFADGGLGKDQCEAETKIKCE